MTPEIIELSDQSLFERMKQCTESCGLIVYPTDTSYGLGANALDDSSVLRVYGAKGRDRNKTLSIVVSKGTLAVFGQYNSKIDLIDQFLPGPLTIILYQNGQLSQNLNVNEPEKVAFRVLPTKFLISQFIDSFHIPLTATSANLSASPENTLNRIIRDLPLRKTDLVIRAELPMSFVPSTVVDLTCTPPKILREGLLSRELREAGCLSYSYSITKKNL